MLRNPLIARIDSKLEEINDQKPTDWSGVNATDQSVGLHNNYLLVKVESNRRDYGSSRNLLADPLPPSSLVAKIYTSLRSATGEIFNCSKTNDADHGG